MILRFLNHLETERANKPQTRNQRLAAIRSFFEYIGSSEIELLDHSQKVTSIPFKRFKIAPTGYLERDEMQRLLGQFTGQKSETALRHHALLLFLYNTGARAQEAADLRMNCVDLDFPGSARICGKGQKWRVCPLWQSTVDAIKASLASRSAVDINDPVFVNRYGAALTRFGIYYLVRKYAKTIETEVSSRVQSHVSPHTLRHSTAVHLLEAGVEVNVIRGWLGHASLETTNRYAEINTKTKEKALRSCEIGALSDAGPHTQPNWKRDDDLLNWLRSL